MESSGGILSGLPSEKPFSSFCCRTVADVSGECGVESTRAVLESPYKCETVAPGACKVEAIAHEVEFTITRLFELGKFQVTQAEYEAVMSANPSYTQSPNLPVEGVSWEDAQKFCEALNNKKDRYHYR
jgi:formylglycine-generating enzyme required for sulfatase activity